MLRGRNERWRFNVHETRRKKSLNSAKVLPCLVEIEIQVITAFPPPAIDNPLSQLIANSSEVLKSVYIEHTPFLAQWYKSSPIYNELHPSSQQAMLQANLEKSWILTLSKQSLARKDVLLIGPNLVLNRYGACFENEIGHTILNEVVETLEELNLDDYEFASLKAMALFDPFSLSDKIQTPVKMFRKQVYVELIDYITQGVDRAETGRLVEISLILPILERITFQLRQLASSNGAQVKCEYSNSPSNLS